MTWLADRIRAAQEGKQAGQPSGSPVEPWPGMDGQSIARECKRRRKSVPGAELS